MKTSYAPTLAQELLAKAREATARACEITADLGQEELQEELATIRGLLADASTNYSQLRALFDRDQLALADSGPIFGLRWVFAGVTPLADDLATAPWESLDEEERLERVSRLGAAASTVETLARVLLDDISRSGSPAPATADILARRAKSSAGLIRDQRADLAAVERDIRAGVLPPAQLVEILAEVREHAEYAECILLDIVSPEPVEPSQRWSTWSPTPQWSWPERQAARGRPDA